MDKKDIIILDDSPDQYGIGDLKAAEALIRDVQKEIETEKNQPETEK